MLRSFLMAIALLGLGDIATTQAEPYPSRPIKLVVPFIAGSPVDALARTLAQQVSPRLGQNIFIDNQPGAGGTIGTNVVAHAEPDGYSLLFALNSHAYGLYKTPNYDPVTSFVAVAIIAQWSHVLVVRPSLPVRSVQELIAFSKANPGMLTYGFGINTPPQVLGETLKIVSGADIRSIPYQGGAQAVVDLLGGRIDMNFGATSTLLPLIKQGKLRVLAFTGATRRADLPDVPTINEAGFPQLAFNPDAWAMILAPAATPREIVEQLNRVINERLASEEVLATFVKLGYQASPASPEQAADFLVSEIKKWPPIVKAAGLKVD